jgi:L-2-hydroxyglutarate oxidase
MDELERRGQANGLSGVRRLTEAEVREREPHVRCIAGLLVPETGIVDYRAVSAAYARRLLQAGGTLVMGARVARATRNGHELRVETSRGTVTCRALVNCAGLYSDRIARACGVEPGVRIVPSAASTTC